MPESKREKRRARKARRALQERRKRWRNWAVIAVIVFALAFFAWIQSRPAEPLASAEILALGAQVYNEACATCHGENGEGHVLQQAPALDASEHAWHHPDGQIQALIVNGGSAMPAFGDQLADDEVVAVIRYVQNWWTAQQLESQQQASEAYPLE